MARKRIGKTKPNDGIGFIMKKTDQTTHHFMYLSLSCVRILAEDLASRKRPPTSLISSFVMVERPLTFVVRAAGVSY